MINSRILSSSFLLAAGCAVASGCGSSSPSNEEDPGASSGGLAATMTGGTGNGSGGGVGTGGIASGGASTGTGGALEGSGGTVDGNTLPVVKSSGCSMTEPVSGARTIEVEGETGHFILSLPSTYSPDTAYPLGFAFHGFGRTHENCQDGDCKGFQSVMGEEAVLVYMKSFSDGWEQQEVRDQNATFFESVLDQILAETCIDQSRVFVAGTSSGAHFANVLACRYGDRLLATAPVAGYLPESEGCAGKIAAIVIHGIDDTSFEAGQDARDFYVTRNGCTTDTMPDLAEMHAQIRASRDLEQTNQACVDYQGCEAGLPVRWCEHSEGGYDNSTHGWPTAGGQMIWDFIQQF